MRDDHNGFTLLSHAAQDGKKLFDFLRSQNRGGFVKDQQASVTIEGFQQFNALLLAD